jgi:FdhE protein
MTAAERGWEVRIERARALQDRDASFAAAMRLYEATLEFQRGVARDSTFPARPETPLRKQIDLSFACSKLPDILDVAQRYGPDPLRQRAEALQQQGEPVWRRLLESALDLEKKAHGEMDDFFIRACLQPIAEILQCRSAADRNYTKNICPTCDGLPQFAVLRPEGEGASRSLVCSFCLREWLYRRVVCPVCGEEDKEKLPRYSAEECRPVHVEGCDTCRHYLKAVDPSIDGRAVPLVDEAATAVLDVWATEHGYTKLIPNLIGF